MSVNLRGVFRPLLEQLGLPETEFWEIERACRTAGLFSATRPGPGGGTMATQQSIVLTVTVLLAGGLTKREGARRAQYYVRTVFRRQPGLSSCPKTGATDFGEALRKILYDFRVAALVIDVTIVHDLLLARIRFRASGDAAADRRDIISEFTGGPRNDTRLRTTATTIQNPFFSNLARQILDLGLTEEEPESDARTGPNSVPVRRRARRRGANE
jgi:hypothetical protein